MAMEDIPKKEKDIAHLSRREFIDFSLKVGLIFGTIGGGISIMDKALAKEQGFRALGLGVSLQDRMTAKFYEDTGIKIESTLGTEIGMMNKMITGGYQIYSTVEENCFMTPPMWEKGILLPIPVEKISNWKDAHPRFADPDGLFAENMFVDAHKQTHFKVCPQICNADAFGYLPDKIEEFGWDAKKTSWTALFDEKYRGKAAIANFPTQVIANTLMYLEYHKKIPAVTNFTNPTKEEVDRAIEFLIPLKRAGHFRVIWNEYGQLVNLFASREVWISDAWNPVIEDVKRLGTPCLYALPVEGLRAWSYGIMVSKAAPDPELAFKYCDWWLEGWAGAQVATQGYYSPCQKPVRKYLGEVEFGYWYEGKENPERAPYNFREGGSWDSRFSRARCIDIWPDEFEYMTKVWNDFRAA
jgi:putative spermidine/putrescine transport system substrate-binding protein